MSCLAIFYFFFLLYITKVFYFKSMCSFNKFLIKIVGSESDPWFLLCFTFLFGGREQGSRVSRHYATKSFIFKELDFLKFIYKITTYHYAHKFHNDLIVKGSISQNNVNLFMTFFFSFWSQQERVIFHELLLIDSLTFF